MQQRKILIVDDESGLRELVRINLLIDGEELTMCSCSTCDRRSWHRGNEEVQLGGVLHDGQTAPTLAPGRGVPRYWRPSRSK